MLGVPIVSSFHYFLRPQVKVYTATDSVCFYVCAPSVINASPSSSRPFFIYFRRLIFSLLYKETLIYPRFTDFQDFYGGEMGINLKAAGINDNNLPVGGNGYFISGPQKGLKATFCGLLEPGDWTHTRPNTAIPAPLLTSDRLIGIIREAMSRKNTAIMNVSIYQDGSISPETFALLQQLKKAVLTEKQ